MVLFKKKENDLVQACMAQGWLTESFHSSMQFKASLGQYLLPSLSLVYVKWVDQNPLPWRRMSTAQKSITTSPTVGSLSQQPNKQGNRTQLSS